MKKLVRAGATGLAALLASASAHAAVVITAGGGAQTFSVTYDGYIDETLTTGLTATGLFSLSGSV